MQPSIRRISNIIGLVMLVICAPFVIRQVVYQIICESVTPEPFYFFDNTELSGHIKYISPILGKSTYFSIEEDSNEYYRIHIVGINRIESFRDLAMKGDLITKHKLSDTLILYKGEVLHYFEILDRETNK